MKGPNGKSALAMLWAMRFTVAESWLVMLKKPV